MIYIVSNCDAYRTYSSMRTRGVFDNEIDLRKALIKLFDDGDFDFDSYDNHNHTNCNEEKNNSIKRKIQTLPLKELCDHICYLNISVFNNNELV